MKIYLVLFVLLSSVYFVFGFNCTSKDEDLAEGCALARNVEKNDSFPINETTKGDIFLTFYLKVGSHASILLIDKPADSKSNENKMIIDITTNGFNISLSNGTEKYHQEDYVVSPVEWREFWIRISTVHGWIKIGKGGNDIEFVSSNYSNGFHVHYYTIASFDASFIHGCRNYTLETMRNRIEQYNVNTLKCALHSMSNHTVPPKITSQNKLQMNFEDRSYEEVFTAQYGTLFPEEIRPSVSTLIKMTWKDERLAWKPKQQYDQNSVEIYPIDSIWTPTIITKFGLNTKTYPKKFNDYHGHDVEVSYDGTVSWMLFISDAMYKRVDRHTAPTCALNLEVDVPFEIHVVGKKPNGSRYYLSWIATQTAITYREPTNDSHASWEATINVTFKNIKKQAEQQYRIEEMWDLVSAPKSRVNIMFILTSWYSDLNIEEGVFKLEGKASIFWTDDRQSWTPEYFNNVTSVSVYYIGHLPLRPKITLRDELLLPKYEMIEEYTKLNVSYTGQVFIEKDLSTRTRCSIIDSRSWPWDVQKCRIDFKPDTDDTISQVSLYFTNESNNHSHTTEWKVVKSEVVTSQRFISVEITLQKRDSSLQTAIRSIYVVIGTITLLSFWLSPWNSWKTTAKRFSLLMLGFFFIFLMYEVPQFTTVAFKFLIGYVTLIFIVTWSTHLSNRFINFARKEYSSPSRGFALDFVNHPIVQSVSCLWIDMKFVNQDENECAMDNLKSETVQTNDAAHDSKALANRQKKFFQKNWLKVAVITERLFFLISFPIVLCLGVSLMF